MTIIDAQKGAKFNRHIHGPCSNSFPTQTTFLGSFNRKNFQRYTLDPNSLNHFAALLKALARHLTDTPTSAALVGTAVESILLFESNLADGSERHAVGHAQLARVLRGILGVVLAAAKAETGEGEGAGA